MKKNLLTLSLIAAVLPNTTWAEVTLFDYEEASSAYEDAYVSGRFNMNSGNQDQTSYDLNVNADYERVFSTPDRDVSFGGNLQGFSERGGTEGDNAKENYLGNAAASMNRYFIPGSQGTFWYSDAEVGIKKGADDPRLKVGAGLGYGRVVNVTPMAKALRLVEALREKGMMRGDLNRAEYNSLAKLIAREDEYKSRFGLTDYEQNWLSEVEAILSLSGQINGELGAAGILIAREVLIDERISTRKHGWLVKGGVSGVLSDYDGESSKPGLDVGAEYHRPLSNQTQFSNETSLSATLKDSDGSYNVANDMSLTHEVSDRVDWINSWALGYDHSEKLDRDTTVNTVSSTYRYYISNKLSFDTVASLNKVDDEVDNNGNDEIDKSLFMGVTYRLK